MKQMLIVVALVIGAAVLTWMIIAGDEEGGLRIIDDEIGTGRVARAGDVVAVHYTGTLASGAKFDSSFDHEPPEPIEFQLGVGKVIKGWDQGIAGMKEGGKRRLIIPPELAYGAKGGGPIPPNAELHFEVELVKVQ
jgi:FKBP-type peptidyl-prolyl cis-trans isomerase